MKLESRADVGLIAPASRPRIPGPVSGVTAHWNGPAMRLAGRPHSACQQAWRNIQRFHMGRNYTPNPLASGRHWQDVAYTAAVCHHEIAMEGRGPGVRTAANGTAAGNDRWYAVFFMVGEGEEPSPEMLRVAEWYGRTRLGTTRWNRHSDHRSTTCAGTVNRYVQGGRLAAPSERRDYITTDDRGSKVVSWQKDLMRWNSSALPRFGADGDFGAETAEWTVRFMESVGLTPSDPERPRVGPVTLDAMKNALQGETTPDPEEELMALSEEAQEWLQEFYEQGQRRDDVRPSSLWHVLDWLRDTREFFSRYFR